MIIGIDASNIKSGGGLTHLVELLKAANPCQYGITKVIIWSGENTIRELPEKNWLHKITCLTDEKTPIGVSFWRFFYMARYLRKYNCNLLFVPGGSYIGYFRPFVTISQNLLPFEIYEIKRYGFSTVKLRLFLLRIIQSITFRRADGLIFLTEYAENIVQKIIKKRRGNTIQIPHGVNENFRSFPKKQIDIENYSVLNPFRFLYLSIVDFYKHQCQVAEAVANLRKKGFPIVLDFVGPAYLPALSLLDNVLNNVDINREYIKYSGQISYEKIPNIMKKADAFIFASSCENMPNILLEAMASGLPIACSNKGPMPEIVGRGGVYFNPEISKEIENVLEKMLISSGLRTQITQIAYKKAMDFNWKKCADDTFLFLASIAEKHLGKIDNTSK